MLLTGFALLLPGVVTLLLVLLLSAILWYYYSIRVLYAKFPSYQADIRVLYWVLKKKHLSRIALPVMTDVCKKYETEGMCVFWVGQPFLFIYSEEAVRTFILDPTAADKPPRIYKLFEFAIGKSIFTCNGEQWKKKRKMISPAFQLCSLKDKIPIINENAAALVQQLSIIKDNTTDETLNFLKYCSLRIFLESSIGVSRNKNPEDELRFQQFLKAVQASSELCIQRFCKPWLYWDIALHLYPSAREVLKQNKTAYNTTNKILQDVMDSLTTVERSCGESETFNEYYGQKPKLFSEILMGKHLKDPSFSMKELQADLIAFTIAGYDTVAHTLMWCLFLLGLHEDIQEKTYQEVLTETEGSIHYENLRNLQYMENVIKETLRLYPAGPTIARRSIKDMQCGKYTVPKNSTVVIFIYMLHRNPEIYPDPEMFNPDRFAQANSKIKQWNYIPFAEGVRNCPGKAFAMIEMKVILAHILRSFKIISLDSREDTGLSWEFMLVPEKHPRIQFIPRDPLPSEPTSR